MSHFDKASDDEVFRHQGPLTMSSLDASMGRWLFRPARKDPKEDDPFLLGWGAVASRQPLVFEFRNLSYATAEGLVGLTSTVESYRDSGGGVIKIASTGGTPGWIEKAGVYQLGAAWDHLGPASEPVQIADSTVIPLWRCSIDDVDTCRHLAGAMAEAAAKTVGTAGESASQELVRVVELVLYEALLNVRDHAYRQDASRWAFGGITLTPIPAVSDATSLSHVTPAEIDWYRKHTGSKMLELVVADCGCNVPSSLWQAFRRNRPDRVPDVGSVAIGTEQGQRLRAALHQDICEWAFHHSSTRKTEQDFETNLARLMCRGLHRATNSACRLSGCILVRSGQARCGHVFVKGSSSSIVHSAQHHQEFPGTALILRIALSEATRQQVALPSLGTPVSSLRVEHFVSGEKQTVSIPRYNQPAEVWSIAHSFRAFTGSNVHDLLVGITEIPPEALIIHSMVAVPSELLDSLSRYEDMPVGVTGTPRLVGFWQPGQHISWKLMGVLPSQVRDMVRALEERGAANLAEREDCRRFAADLVQTHGKWFRADNDSVRLTIHGVSLDPEDEERSLQLAFRLWEHKTRSEPWWLFEGGETVVYRLTTGRLVRRYASVLAMLYANDMLAAALGRKLAHCLGRFRTGNVPVTVLTDSEASYFIARRLLTEDSSIADLYLADHIPDHVLNRPFVLFVDAIYKGETVRSIAAKHGSCLGIIVGVDLRKHSEHVAQTDRDDIRITVTPLMRMPFDPQEVPPAERIAESTVVWEVDRVTHIPTPKPSEDKWALATSTVRDGFLVSHPEVFRYGLQSLSGRYHSVVLSTHALVQTHHVTLRNWICEELAAVLPKRKDGRKWTLVLFTRHEANVGGAFARSVGQTLAEKALRGEIPCQRVFHAVLPFVPSGPSEIFARPTTSIYDGARPIGIGTFHFEAPEPPVAAVLLDDAAVTGKSLRNYLLRVASASSEDRPTCVVAMPVVSRFSPSEEYLFAYMCREITPLNLPQERISFFLRPLFRLQVKSFEKVTSLTAYQVALEMRKLAGILPEELDHYVSTVFSRMERLRLAQASGSRPHACLVQHPFFPGEQDTAEVLSLAVIRIRHLLALFEQNAPVLHEVLREILTVCENRDFGLLTALALEPYLLMSTPIRRECWQDISKLALAAVSQNPSPHLVSDALSVLLSQGDAAIRDIVALLPRIAANEPMFNQLLVMLLTSVGLGRTSRSAFAATLGPAIHTVPPRQRRMLHGVMMHALAAEPQREEMSREAALATIFKLIQETSPHSEGLDKMKAMSNWVYQNPAARLTSPPRDLQHRVRDAAQVIHDALLPGLKALQWWAAANHRLDAADALRSAYLSLARDCYALTGLCSPLTGDVIDPAIIVEVEVLWESIRDFSFKQPTENCLMECSPGHRAAQPTLEAWLPEFFSAPEYIATSVAAESASSISVECDKTKVNVAPVPANELAKLFRFLLHDMATHGKDGGGRIAMTLQDHRLCMSFENVVRGGYHRGRQRSQRLARDLSDHLGVQLELDKQKGEGEVYRARVSIAEVVEI